VIGLHFFSPANIMKLLEIVVPAKVAPDVVTTAFELAKRMKKVPVRAGVCDGFIGNRILTAYRQAAEFALEDGAEPADVDAAMRAFGFPLGPFQVSDLAGLQISWARRKRLAPTRDPAHRYVAVADRLCEAGRFGQSAGRGWYDYPEGAREGVPSPDVSAVIAGERVRKGIVPRAFTAEALRDRCLAAMANEGAKILAEGIALRPSDIDTVLLFGYGFPRWEGGPMHWADRFGILQLRNLLRDLAPEAPEFWTPAPGLDDMIKNGRHFADMNGG